RRALLALRVARRQDDDRGGSSDADPADHLESVDAGQAEIEDHEIRPDTLVQIERVLPATRGLDVQTVATEIRRDGAENGWLVIDDEDPRSGGALHQPS